MSAREIHNFTPLLEYRAGGLITVNHNWCNTCGLNKLDPCHEQETQVDLDTRDEFEAVVMNILTMYREKRDRYAIKDDPYFNFYKTAEMTGLSALRACEVLKCKHEATLQKFWLEYGDVEETTGDFATGVSDAILDRAVYAIIFAVLAKRVGVYHGV